MFSRSSSFLLRRMCSESVSAVEPLVHTSEGPPLPTCLLALPPTACKRAATPPAEAKEPTKPVSSNFSSGQTLSVLRTRPPSVLYELSIFVNCLRNVCHCSGLQISCFSFTFFFFTFLGCGRLSHFLGQRKSLEGQAVFTEGGRIPPTSLSPFLPECSPRPGEQE